MDVKPLLHKHYLLFDQYKKQEACCEKCNQNIDGWAFTCELCKFWLHQSCAEKKLPPMISHPLLSKPLLQKINYEDFVCDKCFTLSRGCRYSNEDHSFNLDVICASSINDQAVKEESKRSKDMSKKIKHFCHDHSLTLFNYRKVRWYEYCCSWCEKPLSGMSYGCLQSFHIDPFFLHKFCIHTIPYKILEHPSHHHPLYIKISGLLLSKCNVCVTDLFNQYCYSRRTCDFEIHLFCAKLRPTLRHECHNHHLTYIIGRHECHNDYLTNIIGLTKNSICKKCKEGVKGSDLYRCVQCNYDFHFLCIIPFIITHKYHIHSLTVTTSLKEDGLGEYYCDICEEQRNPKHPVYFCKECTYIAHIECGLGNKVVDAKLHWGSTSSLKHKEIEQKDLDFITHRQGLEINHVDHEHPLIFKEAIEKNEIRLCRGCEVEVCDEAYVCRERCTYCLHKKCAELSSEVLLPLHSLDHPLFCLREPIVNLWSPYSTLISVEKRKYFICDNCREVSGGFRYYCYQCNFKLDVKCIVGTASDIVKQGPKGIERPTNLFHFIHNHELLLANCRPTSERSFCCDACSWKISGPAYCCLQCDLFVHESCLGKLPRQIQIQFHPQHSLFPSTYELYEAYPQHSLFLTRYERHWACLACKSRDPSIRYNCLQCGIYIHFSCAASLLQCPLISKSHPHNLYLFSRDKPILLQKLQSSKCAKCCKLLKNRSIYRCVPCDINFHLQCAEIFYRVKCKYHIHPLTLRGCFAEDDSGEYYCDVCEEKRDPENDVYYCEKCDGQFISHIECAAAEVQKVILQYGPFPYSLPEHFGDDVDEWYKRHKWT